MNRYRTRSGCWPAGCGFRAGQDRGFDYLNDFCVLGDVGLIDKVGVRPNAVVGERQRGEIDDVDRWQHKTTVLLLGLSAGQHWLVGGDAGGGDNEQCKRCFPLKIQRESLQRVVENYK